MTPNDGCSATCTVESRYTWTGGSGTSKDTCSKIYSCPSGYTWTIGSCTSISDCTNLSYSCSSGYTWKIGSCTSISDCTNLGYSCPSGYTWKIGSCTSISDCTNLGYSCPSGYTWKIGFCSSINDCTNLGYSCPSGYTWKIGFCSSINDCTNLGYSCPSGYTWKIGFCSSINDCTNLGYSCPSGYTWKIGFCSSINDCTNLGYSCPSGYTWKIGFCSSINDCTNLGYSCPSGYTWKIGSCTSISDCTNLGYSCPSGYTWTIGSCTSISDCTNLGYSCPSGYTWTIGSCTSINDCSQTVTSTCPFDYNFSLFNRWMAFIMWSAIIIIFIIDLIDGYLSDCYPSGLFTWLEHIQLFTILPLAGSCFSSEVNGFFRLASYSLLGFNFINIKEMFSIGSDYSQDNKVLSSIGFSSSSTIINIGGYLIIGLLIVIGEVIVCILYRYKYQNSDDGNINANWCAFNLTPRLKQWIWFGAPIRYLLLGLVLVNTAGIEELNSYSDSSHRWSWWFAWFILFVFPFMFNCTVLYAILSKSHQDLNESNVFSELVSGLKNNRVAKLYSLLFKSEN